MKTDGTCVQCPLGVDCLEPGAVVGGVVALPGYFAVSGVASVCPVPNSCLGFNLW